MALPWPRPPTPVAQGRSSGGRPAPRPGSQRPPVPHGGRLVPPPAAGAAAAVPHRPTRRRVGRRTLDCPTNGVLPPRNQGNPPGRQTRRRLALQKPPSKGRVTWHAPCDSLVRVYLRSPNRVSASDETHSS